MSIDFNHAISVKPEPGKELCDFCACLGPVWLYSTRDEIVAIPPRGSPPDIPAHGYDSGWLACAECATLIDKNARFALLNRAMNTNPAMLQITAEYGGALPPDVRTFLAQNLGALHDCFFATRYSKIPFGPQG